MDETVKNEEVTEEAAEPVQEENTPAEEEKKQEK